MGDILHISQSTQPFLVGPTGLTTPKPEYERFFESTDSLLGIHGLTVLTGVCVAGNKENRQQINYELAAHVDKYTKEIRGATDTLNKDLVSFSLDDYTTLHSLHEVNLTVPCVLFLVELEKYFMRHRELEGSET